MEETEEEGVDEMQAVPQGVAAAAGHVTLAASVTGRSSPLLTGVTPASSDPCANCGQDAGYRCYGPAFCCGDCERAWHLKVRRSRR